MIFVSSVIFLADILCIKAEKAAAGLSFSYPIFKDGKDEFFIVASLENDNYLVIKAKSYFNRNTNSIYLIKDLKDIELADKFIVKSNNHE